MSTRFIAAPAGALVVHHVFDGDASYMEHEVLLGLEVDTTTNKGVLVTGSGRQPKEVYNYAHGHLERVTVVVWPGLSIDPEQHTTMVCGFAAGPTPRSALAESMALDEWRKLDEPLKAELRGVA